MDGEENVPDTHRALVTSQPQESPPRFTRKMLDSAKPSDMAKTITDREEDSPSLGFSASTSKIWDDANQAVPPK